LQIQNKKKGEIFFSPFTGFSRELLSLLF